MEQPVLKSRNINEEIIDMIPFLSKIDTDKFERVRDRPDYRIDTNSFKEYSNDEVGPINFYQAIKLRDIAREDSGRDVRLVPTDLDYIAFMTMPTYRKPDSSQIPYYDYEWRDELLLNVQGITPEVSSEHTIGGVPIDNYADIKIRLGSLQPPIVISNPQITFENGVPGLVKGTAEQMDLRRIPFANLHDLGNLLPLGNKGSWNGIRWDNSGRAAVTSLIDGFDGYTLGAYPPATGDRETDVRFCVYDPKK